MNSSERLVAVSVAALTRLTSSGSLVELVVEEAVEAEEAVGGVDVPILKYQIN